MEKLVYEREVVHRPLPTLLRKLRVIGLAAKEARNGKGSKVRADCCGDDRGCGRDMGGFLDGERADLPTSISDCVLRIGK